MYVHSSELGLSHPLSRQRVCPSPRNQRGGGHSRLRTIGEKLSTLSTLCFFAFYSLYGRCIYNNRLLAGRRAVLDPNRTTVKKHCYSSLSLFHSQDKKAEILKLVFHCKEIILKEAKRSYCCSLIGCTSPLLSAKGRHWEQSIQSAWLSFQSSKLGPHTASPARECCSTSLWIRGGGGAHSIAGAGDSTPPKRQV